MDDSTGSTNVSNDESTKTTNWRGSSMEEIHRYLNEFELEHLPPVRPSEQHTVLHHYPIRRPDNQPPSPLKAHHKWDAAHVRLPCSSKSQYPVTGPDGTATIEPRWELIEQALLRPITNSHELQAVILSYNSKYDGQWNFRALHRLFEDELDDSETRVFFEDLLPRIVRLALRLPELIQAPIPLLKQGQTHTVSLTQEQIACLLANAFLCTFPRRNTLKRKSEYSTFPDINFNRLFQSSGQCVLEKIKCICHYFRRVCPTERDSLHVPTGVVTFSRRSLHHNDMPNWEQCDAPLGVTPLHITSTGTIEDQGLGLLQVDFANKYLGGGVLGSGCVQEEIRFVICPELLVSKLFTECLRPTEALLMVGCERYSNYTGYASTFQWAGNHEDNTPRDTSRRRLTHIVAIDALAFRQPLHQYREDLMLRELNKAFVGFLHTLETPAPGVASGNWGCGAFGGEASLKALLQLMVCTVTKRPLVYYTFGNEELRDAIHRMHNFLVDREVRVQDLWATLRKYKPEKADAKELYEFIYNSHSNKPQRSPCMKKMNQRRLNSDATNAPTASSSKTTGNAGKKRDLHTKAGDVSRDLFASTSASPSSSSSSPVSPVQAVAKPVETPPTVAKQISISDESDTDAVLLAAVGDTPARKVAEQNGTPTKQMRQRTLLEMLDQCYTDGNPQPASKRVCHTTQ